MRMEQKMGASWQCLLLRDIGYHVASVFGSSHGRKDLIFQDDLNLKKFDLKLSI